MACNSRNLLNLVDESSDKELNVSLEILRSELACWDKNVSWLPLLESQLDLYKNVGILNLYDKIRMLVELRKLTPKIIQLQNDLMRNIESSKNMCLLHPFDFNLSLSQNLQQHSASCALNNPNRILVKPVLAHPTPEHPKPTQQNTQMSQKSPQPKQKTPQKQKSPQKPPTENCGDLEKQFYPPSIVRMVRSIDNCQTSTVRVSPDGTVHCLLCNFEAAQRHTAHLKQHVAGKAHKSMVDTHRESLRKHYAFWKTAKKEYQTRQCQFLFCDEQSVECTICKANVSFKNVCKHLDKCPEVARPATTKSYDEHTEETIFAGVPSITIKGTDYPMIQVIDDNPFCLICNKTMVEVDYADHINGLVHADQANSPETKNNFKMYHDIWMSMPAKVQTQQIYFRRRSNKMTCMACSTCVNYSVGTLRNHVMSKSHEKYVAMMESRNGKALVGSVTSNSRNSNYSDTSSNNISELAVSCSSSALGESNKTDSREASSSSDVLIGDPTFKKFVEALRDFDGFKIRFDSNNSDIKTANVDHGVLIKQEDKELFNEEVTLEDHTVEDPSSTHPSLSTMSPKKEKTTPKKETTPPKNKPIEIKITTDPKKPTPKPDKTPQNLQFPPYDKSLIDDIYPDGLLHYSTAIGNVKYPMIQNVGPYKHCLVCAENVSSILFHLNSGKHAANEKHEINRQLLKSYHDVFVRLPLKLQFEQKHMRKELRLLCVLCDEKVRYDAEELFRHVESADHGKRKSLLRNKEPNLETKYGVPAPETGIKIEPLSPNDSPKAQTPIPTVFPIENPPQRCAETPVKKILKSSNSPTKTKNEPVSDENTRCEEILRQMYPPQLSRLIRRQEGLKLTFDTFQAEKGTSKFLCLLCERSFVKTALESHVTTKAHQKRFAKGNRLKAVEIYHFRWNTMLPRHKILQQELSPVNASLTFCKTCCINVKYADVGQHLDKFHLSDQKYCLKDKLTPDFTFKSDITYVPEIEQIYRHNEPQCNLIVANTTYPLIQTGAVVMRCLLCRQDVAYDKGGFRNASDMDTVRAHLDTARHKAFMVECDAKNRFKLYHDVWMGYKSEIQRQQLLFFGDTRKLFCNLCGCSVKMAAVAKHVAKNSRHHDLEFDEFGNLVIKAGQVSPITQATKQQALQEHLGVSVDGSDYSGSDSELTDVDDLSDSLATGLVVESASKLKLETTNTAQNGHATVEEAANSTEHADNIENININDSAKTLTLYKPSVRNRIYFDLEQYTVSIYEVEYPVFRRTMQGMRCIICHDKPVLHPGEHSKILAHGRACEDDTAREALKQFHHFWSKLAENVQHEQVFVVNDQCVLCHKEIPFENVRSHLKSKAHESRAASATGEVLHQTLGLKFLYSPEVYSALYGSVPSQQTVDIDGEIYPVLRRTEQGVRCVVCHNVFVKTSKDHLSSACHREILKDSENLRAVAKFHKHWMAQEPAIQMEQRHVVQGKCVLCDRNVSGDGAVIHMKSKGHQLKMQQVNKKEKDREDSAKKHDITDSIPNAKAPHMIKHLPVYLNSHLSHLKWDDDVHDEVACTKCKKICRTSHELRLHLDSQPHVNATQVPRKFLKFYCELCRKWYPCETTWNMHLVDPVHIEQTSKVGAARQAKLRENLCVTCAVVFYGDTMAIIRHRRGGTDEPEVKLSGAVKRFFASKEFIVAEAERLLKLATDAAKDQAREERCCLALVRALKGEFPNCTAYAFGSRVTALGYDDSDLDVFLDIGKMYDGKRQQSSQAQADIVHSVASILQRNRKTFTDINKVPTARTPIIQVYHVETGIDCDISFRHGLSVENTKFVRFCLDLQPSIRAAMLYLKEWYAKSDLPSGITSYALIMMLIYYLQTEGYLLSVARVRELNQATGPVINGWETIKYTKPLAAMRLELPDCTMSVPELLSKFFEFYASFDFGKLVVCPLMGRPIAKLDFQLRKVKLPGEMSAYMKKLAQPNPELFRITAMCIQDPFDLSHNLTKACSESFVRTFKKYCVLTKAQIDGPSG